jgi:hypothetical protein
MDEVMVTQYQNDAIDAVRAARLVVNVALEKLREADSVLRKESLGGLQFDEQIIKDAELARDCIGTVCEHFAV